MLTVCDHAGIVNNVRYAQKLTGIEQIYAIIGGFHLGGMTPEPLIQQTCDALAEFALRPLSPPTVLASRWFIAWQTCTLTPSSKVASGHTSSCSRPFRTGQTDRLITIGEHMGNGFRLHLRNFSRICIVKGEPFWAKFLFRLSVPILRKPLLRVYKGFLPTPRLNQNHRTLTFQNTTIDK